MSWFSFGTSDILEKADNKGHTKKQLAEKNEQLKQEIKVCSRDISKLIATLKHEIKMDENRAKTEFIAIRNATRLKKFDIAKQHSDIAARLIQKTNKQTKLLAMATDMETNVPQVKNQRAVYLISRQLTSLYKLANEISSRELTPQTAVDYSRERQQFLTKQEMTNEILTDSLQEDDEVFIEDLDGGVITLQQLSMNILHQAVDNDNLNLVAALSTPVLKDPIKGKAEMEGVEEDEDGNIVLKPEDLDFIVKNEMRLKELRGPPKRPIP